LFSVVFDSTVDTNQAALAASFAIFAAKQAGAEEVTADHILLGCLRTISRFGIATMGAWSIDLETLGVDWVRQPEGPRPKVTYSQQAVDLFDQAAKIARSSGDAAVGVNHMLAAFAGEESGLMGELKRTFGITSALWRTAVAQLGDKAVSEPAQTMSPEAARDEAKPQRDYLTPEEAAEALGVHVQTMRAYIRSERLPAFRLAGERAIRILRSDLEKVLEPLKGAN
jgi:excisionase family DNA binding protein